MSDAIAKARAEGAAAERERISKILTAPGAAGHEALAITLALADGMTAEAAMAVLSDQPGGNKVAEFEAGRAIARNLQRQQGR